MAELERARAHLRKCQIGLAAARQCGPRIIPEREDAVLAALTWVWEEQQKQKREQENERLALWATRHASLA